MKRLFRLEALLIVVVSLIEALGTAVAHAAENGNFAGLVDIGGSRKMYLKCSGSGSPTVVLIGGLRASAEDWSISDKSKPIAGVFAAIVITTTMDATGLSMFSALPLCSASSAVSKGYQMRVRNPQIGLLLPAFACRFWPNVKKVPNGLL
jgi:hypothetical protein